MRYAAIAAAAVALISSPAAAAPVPLGPGATGWRDGGSGPVRGITIGPIENARHPGRGYGSNAYVRAVVEAARMGATWVSLTPFGRVVDLTPSGIDLEFELDHRTNMENLRQAIVLAHRAGLKVMVVPHLWVESGGWRALIEPGDDDAWKRWAAAYRAFAVGWARVAEQGGAEMFSVGVEQRSWVTTHHAPLYREVIADVRHVYHGTLTYSANWDDAAETAIFGDVDVIGINAFYPLAEKEGARLPDLLKGGARVAAEVRTLASRWQKPVLFTEIGYTTRKDPALRPWEWPDAMKDVQVDELAQAEAYAGLIAPLLDEPSFAGFFVWRVYADPDDVSQEAEWGFSPRGKLAELVMRDAFSTWWAADGPRLPGDAPARFGAEAPGLLPGPSGNRREQR
jgi:hypothetical protein